MAVVIAAVASRPRRGRTPVSIVARPAGCAVVQPLANVRHEIVEIERFLKYVEAADVGRVWMRRHDQGGGRIEQPFTWTS